MKQNQFTVQNVVSFPRPLDEGVLYVSDRFAASAHKCACGCGNDVVLALNPAQWQLAKHPDGSASLTPSIDNSSLPCRSHYWFRHGRVDWYPRLTHAEAIRARTRDRQARDSYFQELNQGNHILGRLRKWINRFVLGRR